MEWSPAQILVTVAVAAGLLFLVGKYFLIKAGLEKVGREYCLERGYRYVGIKHANSHFSVVYKSNGKRRYAKFIARLGFFGNVRRVEWLA